MMTLLKPEIALKKANGKGKMRFMLQARDALAINRDTISPLNIDTHKHKSDVLHDSEAIRKMINFKMLSNGAINHLLYDY